MDLGLKGKSVIVMASSQGLGKATALEFAREGANVLIFGRTEERLKQAQADILSATGIEPSYTVGDMGSYDDIREVISKTSELF